MDKVTRLRQTNKHTSKADKKKTSGHERSHQQEITDAEHVIQHTKQSDKADGTHTDSYNNHQHNSANRTPHARTLIFPSAPTFFFPQSKTVRQFDTRFTAKQFGFDDAEHYYKASTLYHKLDHIKVPFICLNSGDDLFQPLNGKVYL